MQNVYCKWCTTCAWPNIRTMFKKQFLGKNWKQNKKTTINLKKGNWLRYQYSLTAFNVHHSSHKLLNKHWVVTSVGEAYFVVIPCHIFSIFTTCTLKHLQDNILSSPFNFNNMEDNMPLKYGEKRWNVRRRKHRIYLIIIRMSTT